MTAIAPSSRQRWLRRLAILAAVCVVLLISLYWVATSAPFLKGVVLPRVGESLHARVTVSDLSVSPFSRLQLEGLTIQTTRGEPILSAQRVRASYSLAAILGGTIKVTEAVVDSPVLTVVQNPDGSTNLDPLLQSGDTPNETPDAGGAPPTLDIARVRLNNVTVRFTKRHDPTHQDVTELSGLNLALDNIRNGNAVQLGFSSDLHHESHSLTPGNGSQLRAAAEATLNIELAPDLTLSGLSGAGRFRVRSAQGGFAQLNALGADLTCDLSPERISDFSLALFHQSNTLAEVRLHGPLALATQEGQLTVALTNLHLNQWQGLLGPATPDASVHLSLEARSQRSARDLAFDLEAFVDNITIQLGSNRVDNAAARLLVQAQLTDFVQARWNAFQLQLRHQDKPVLSLASTGAVRLDTLESQLHFTLDSALANLPHLLPQPGLAISSGQLNVTGDLSQSNRQQSVAARIQLTGLTGTFDGNSLTNFGAAVSATARHQNQRLQIQPIRISLPPTRRAKNEMRLSGELDLSTPGVTTGELELAADSLDLTPLYELLTRPSRSEGAEPAGSPADTPAEPVELPFRNLTAHARVGQLYLREIELTNWQSTIRLDSQRVKVEPLQVSLNGAPIRAVTDVDLSMPGYRYAVDLQLDEVPLEPLVNSFLPGSAGLYKGRLLLNADFDGQGTRGTELRQHLKGHFNLGLTNAEIQIASRQLKLLLTPIALLLGINDILHSPLDDVSLATRFGDGNIHVERLHIGSPAFLADTTGTIPIQNDLIDSPLHNWPLTLQLRRAYADKIKGQTSSEADDKSYVRMPDFITVGGTLNEPDPEFNEAKLVGAGLLNYANKIPAIPKKAGDLLKNVGGLLLLPGGKSTNNTATSSSETNSPPTLRLNPLNLFKKKE